MSTAADRARDAELIARAKVARENAHAPYSRYLVGSAILTKTGEVFVGCNVESCSYGATICAERHAVGAMIAAGARDPLACVVVTEGPRPAAPCGMCRQVLAEFASDLRIVLVAALPDGDIVRETTLATLLPEAFTPAALERRASPR